MENDASVKRNRKMLMTVKSKKNRKRKLFDKIEGRFELLIGKI